MQSKQLDFLVKVKEKIKDKRKQYFILTMGCQLNENDSEKLAGMLYDMGYSEASSLENADIIVFNTCCVRENAEERLFGKLGEIKNLKEKKDLIIAIGEKKKCLQKSRKAIHM